MFRKGLGQLSPYSDSLRAGRSGGIESRWEARFFAPVKTSPWGPPSLLYNGYRVITGGKAAGVWRLPPTRI